MMGIFSGNDAKQDESEPEADASEPLELDVEEEMHLRKWCVEQAMIKMGRGTGASIDGDLLEGAKKFYDFIIALKVK